jgi:TPR repeat protein
LSWVALCIGVAVIGCSHPSPRPTVGGSETHHDVPSQSASSPAPSDPICHARSCYEQGLDHRYAHGTRRDYIAAAQWFERGCNQHELRACRELAQALHSGIGVARDQTRAMHVYDDACKSGDEFSCWVIALLNEDDHAADKLTKDCRAGGGDIDICASDFRFLDTLPECKKDCRKAWDAYMIGLCDRGALTACAFVLTGDDQDCVDKPCTWTKAAAERAAARLTEACNKNDAEACDLLARPASQVDRCAAGDWGACYEVVRSASNEAPPTAAQLKAGRDACQQGGIDEACERLVDFHDPVGLEAVRAACKSGRNEACDVVSRHDPVALAEVACKKLASKQFEFAVDAIRKAIELDPGNAKYHLISGYALYEHAIKRSIEDAQQYGHKKLTPATLDQTTINVEKPLDDLNKAIETDPTLWRAQYQLARIYRGQHKASDAKASDAKAQAVCGHACDAPDDVCR